MLAEARRLAAESGIDAAARATENSHAVLSVGDLPGRRYWATIAGLVSGDSGAVPQRHFTT